MCNNGNVDICLPLTPTSKSGLPVAAEIEGPSTQVYVPSWYLMGIYGKYIECTYLAPMLITHDLSIHVIQTVHHGAPTNKSSLNVLSDLAWCKSVKDFRIVQQDVHRPGT